MDKNRPFRLPEATTKKMWGLTQKEQLFLDMTMIFSFQHFELYRMVLAKDITDVAARAKASALVTSSDGRDYISIRTQQLMDFFYPKLDTDKKDTPEEVEDPGTVYKRLEGKVLNKLDTMLNDPNNEAHFDAIKLVMQKLSKDMDSDEQFEPPRRYLPVTCSECAYKQWIDTNAEVLCLKCKFREYGIANGLNLEFQKMFNI